MICPTCKGLGHINTQGGEQVCYECGGSGEVSADPKGTMIMPQMTASAAAPKLKAAGLTDANIATITAAAPGLNFMALLTLLAKIASGGAITLADVIAIFTSA